MPTETISREDFAALVARAGLTLNEAQFETLRQSYTHLRAFTDVLRTPRDRKVEAAHVFHAPKPER